MTIEFLVGTPGSGKSYHALEMIIDTLDKGKHVIANFPLNFTEKMKRDGLADRFMYIPDEFLQGDNGMALLWQISSQIIDDGKPRFFQRGESQCLVVIDEAGNYFPPEDSTMPVQKLWKLFFRQHRKMGYDFALISQGSADINKAIQSCVEYEIAHRKANRVAPFKWLPWTLFFYVRYWKADRKRLLLGNESSIYVKRFARLYDTNMMFGGFDEKMEFDFEAVAAAFLFEFGNTQKELMGVINNAIETIELPAGTETIEEHNQQSDIEGCTCENCREYRILDAQSQNQENAS